MISSSASCKTLVELISVTVRYNVEKSESKDIE